MNKQGVTTLTVATATRTKTKPRPTAADKAKAELAALRATRPVTTDRAPRGSFKELADPDWFPERDKAKNYIADQLQLVLKVRRVSQRKLSEMMGMSQAAVRHKLYGRTSFFADEIVVLAEKLDVDVRIFFDPSMTEPEILKALRP